jgi:hypothetical protein
MLQAVVLWLFTLMASYFIVGLLEQRFKGVDRRFTNSLFFYHSLLTIAYYLYALFNPSDSHNYYQAVASQFKGSNWFDYFGTSTDFVEFIAFFLVNNLGFSYESCMILFAWLGYLGFVFFYLLFREQIKVTPTVFGFDGIKLIFLLPNLHFWSASLGKGSLIFFGFGLFFFALSKPRGMRIVAMLLGGWIIYQIRPHIFFVVLIAIALGYTFSVRGPGILVRVFILAIAAGTLVYIYDDILTLTGLENESILDADFSHRASELSKATSGIDISSYSIPEKMFAFCFRPLFFDAPGVLGFIVSFENLFYLIFFLNLLRPKGLSFIFASEAMVKTCLLTFLGVSLALAQITGNLGIAMRQKSQVMILLMFVILKFLSQERQVEINRLKARKTAVQRNKLKTLNVLKA